MQHQTTINELFNMQGLFSTVDHIKVPETDPNTGTCEEVILPPPLIRRTVRRDATVVWVLTPPGIHERIFVADQAPVTVYYRDVDPGRFTSPHPPQQAAPQQAPPAPTAWQQQQPAPAHQAPAHQAPAHQAPAPGHYPAPQPAATPQRPAAPWTPRPQN
ncbi:hypothetical protein ACFU5O_28305 [Streptomyces sp. NPDC057445]|uniref:hypothetical protein n=1 Tax=Streptomyces sp. NPDC057445 TaxID=3346136 RepID=UPI0036A77779